MGVEEKELESSIPGLAKFSARFSAYPCGDGYMEGRRKIDGAEGFWRINNKLYDLTKFIDKHPGGAEWLEITKGTDITELFETHHLTDKARKLLPRYYIREAVQPRSVPLTFNENGFYKTLKKRSLEALNASGIDFHRPALKTNFVMDSLVLATVLTSLYVACTGSRLAIVIAGVFLSFTMVSAHNYFHMRDNFRMYYWDLCLMSSREWRITHAMSHHMYPNTIWDFEIYALEPFVQWLPTVDASIRRRISWIYQPLTWLTGIWMQGIKRYLEVFFIRKKFEFRDVVPFSLPIAMALVSGDVFGSFKLWLMILGAASFSFYFIGTNGAHHHPDIFHDGDIYRKDLDWGLLEMDSVRDREIVDDSFFLVMTQFGLHSLHHLLPTIDHAYLEICLPALEETCREFGINLTRFTPLELLKGQFRQLRRVEPKLNYI